MQTQLEDEMAKDEQGGRPELRKIPVEEDVAEEALAFPELLREFRSNPAEARQPLTHEDQRAIVEEAIGLLERSYVHLPMKRAMYAVDPLRRLRLLQQRLRRVPSEEEAFNREMTDAFTSLRDWHTKYILPKYFADRVAFLPFRVEDYFVDDKRFYIVSKVAAVCQPRDYKPGGEGTFKAGVQITHWNGVPIERAVDLVAVYHTGGNPDARHARGVDGLTKRALMVTLPPDEDWVTVHYLADGKEQRATIDWLVGRLPTELGTQPDIAGEAVRGMGLDIESDILQRVNKSLFVEPVVRQKRRMTRALRDFVKIAEEEGVSGIPSKMPEVFLANPVHDKYGYLRIFTFYVRDHRAFVNEVVRLLKLLPGTGLIIDVRGNGGGSIVAAERLLGLLQNGIKRCLFQMICTEGNLELCRQERTLTLWVESLKRGLETGATFSAAYPMTPRSLLESPGQKYQGPVVLITDARCYSATEIFAAGFKDNQVGKILGVDRTTGGGGANVWPLGEFQKARRRRRRPLGGEASLQVAFRRTLRADREGSEIEDFGVEPDTVYRFTRDDVLEANKDLIKHAVRLLVGGSDLKILQEEPRPDDGQFACTIEAKNVDAVAASCDGVDHGRKEVVDGRVSFAFPAAPGSKVEFRGFAGDEFVSLNVLRVP